MSGSNPKYLQIPKKVPYNIRLPKPLLDKLNAYAEITGNTTTDIVIGALNDFIKDKTVYNTYLDDVKGLSIRLPVIANEKAMFINSNITMDETYSAYDSFIDLNGYEATTEPYEILYIPNNLDVFDETFGYITPVERIAAKGKHSGIEVAILPEIYSYYDNDNILDALYCFYFEVEMDKVKTIKLIDYMDAINKANDVDNLNLKNKIISCVNELNALTETVSADVDVGDGVTIVDYTAENLEKIAEKYNTGNVIPLGANIDDAIVIAEFKENPEYINGIIADMVDSEFGKAIKDEVADIIDSKLTAIENLLKSDKSKDEVLDAIKNIKIKTND